MSNYGAIHPDDLGPDWPKGASDDYRRGFRDGRQCAIDLAQKNARAYARRDAFIEIWTRWRQSNPDVEFDLWLGEQTNDARRAAPWVKP